MSVTRQYKSKVGELLTSVTIQTSDSCYVLSYFIFYLCIDLFQTRSLFRAHRPFLRHLLTLATGHTGPSKAAMTEYGFPIEKGGRCYFF